MSSASGRSMIYRAAAFLVRGILAAIDGIVHTGFGICYIPVKMPLKTDCELNSLQFFQTMMELPPERAVPDDLPGRWWVAHTRSRNEKSLVSELHALKIASYVPLQRRQTRSRESGRLSRSLIPLFTGYVFFNGTEEQRTRALMTNRIAQTLFVPRQDQLICELRQVHHVLVSGAPLKWHNEIKVGDWARVIAGPLEGAEGVVCGRLSGLRLVLNVQMLGQSVSVHVSRDILELIETPSAERARR